MAQLIKTTWWSGWRRPFQQLFWWSVGSPHCAGWPGQTAIDRSQVTDVWRLFHPEISSNGFSFYVAQAAEMKHWLLLWMVTKCSDPALPRWLSLSLWCSSPLVLTPRSYSGFSGSGVFSLRLMETPSRDNVRDKRWKSV